MSPRSDRSIRLVAALAVALVAVQPAGADDEADDLAGAAERLKHQGVLEMAGPLAMLRLYEQTTSQSPVLVLDAESGQGYHFDQKYLVTAESRSALAPAQTESLGSKTDPLEQIRLRSLGSEPMFDLRVIPLGEANFTLRVRGSLDLAAWEASTMVATAGMEPTGEGSPPDSATDDRHPRFVQRTTDGAVLASQLIGGVSDLHVQGDFLLEFIGLRVSLEAEGLEETHYETGQSETVGDDLAGVSDQKLLRLLVRGGDLYLRQENSPGRLTQLAAVSADVQGDDGRLSLHRFQDVLDIGTPTDRSVRFLRGYEGSLAPRDERVVLTLAGSDREGVAPASAWLSPAGFNPLPIVAGLVTVALIAVALRTGRGTPQLAHMEDALEAGCFGRAARLAGRILRTDPARESAHLGRAIALSRTGRPERVVRDLKRFLRDHEPSDGTLHYVLGLAYRDLGREAAAEEALSEAVQRTPALAQQVPDMPAPPRRGAAEGDAQGYT